MLSDANVRITWTKSGTPSSPCFLMISVGKQKFNFLDPQESCGLIFKIKMSEKSVSVQEHAMEKSNEFQLINPEMTQFLQLISLTAFLN